MSKIIELKNISYTENGVNVLKNINLTFFENENTVITYDNQKSIKTLINLISGNLKATTGEIVIGEFLDKRYFLGYKNFKNILSRELVIGEIIKTLIKSQTSLNINQIEVNELIKILNLEYYQNDLTTLVSEDVIEALNLLLLLIIRPRIILLEKIELIGSTKFQSAAIEYIKDYCKSYKVSLIVGSNQDNIISNLPDRLLEIKNSYIVKDQNINTIETTFDNEIDNKTMKFNLEDDLIEALNYSNSHLENFTKDLNTQKFEIDEEQENSLTNNQNDNGNVIEENFTNINITTSEILEISDVSKRLKQLTKQLDISNDSFESTKRFQKDNEKYDFVSNIRETYQIKENLEKQINSDSFSNYSKETQFKIFDNFEKADNIIRNNDLSGAFNPDKNSISELCEKAEETRDTVTKMLMEESILSDFSTDDDSISNINIITNLTSEIEFSDEDLDSNQEKIQFEVKTETIVDDGASEYVKYEEATIIKTFKLDDELNDTTDDEKKVCSFSTSINDIAISLEEEIPVNTTYILHNEETIEISTNKTQEFEKEIEDIEDEILADTTYILDNENKLEFPEIKTSEYIEAKEEVKEILNSIEEEVNIQTGFDNTENLIHKIDENTNDEGLDVNFYYDNETQKATSWFKKWRNKKKGEVKKEPTRELKTIVLDEEIEEPTKELLVENEFNSIPTKKIDLIDDISFAQKEGFKKLDNLENYKIDVINQNNFIEHQKTSILSDDTKIMSQETNNFLKDDFDVENKTIKTLEPKKRNKLNSIEKLYLEAIEDQNVINEINKDKEK
ncbi:MAG: ABC transporter ATP-binding protein [Mycoplasma sp.]